MAKAKRGNSATAEPPADHQAEAQSPAVNGANGYSNGQTNGHHGNNGKRPGPAMEWRAGRLRLVAWENSSDKGRWFSFVLTRGYKEGDTWKNSNSIGVMDLLPAGLLMSQAFLWTQLQYRNGRTQNPDSEPESNSNGSGDGGSVGDGGEIPF